MVHRTFLQLHSKNISTQLVWCPSHQPLRSQRDYKKHFTPSTCVRAQTPASHGEQTSVLITAATLKISALKKGEIIYLLIDLRDLNLIICMEPLKQLQTNNWKKNSSSKSQEVSEILNWFIEDVIHALDEQVTSDAQFSSLGELFLLRLKEQISTSPTEIWHKTKRDHSSRGIRS